SSVVSRGSVCRLIVKPLPPSTPTSSRFPYTTLFRSHHGRAEIAKFWDASIANVSRFEFDIRDSHAAGDEVANVGTITTFFPGAFRVDTEGVFVYRVGEQGLILSMRAFWETERAMATARQVAE